MSDKGYIKTGFSLFINTIIVNAGNGLFWLFISKFLPTSDVGHATTIVSLVMLVNTIIQLGFEYPLLKHSYKSNLFGTVLFIELVLSLASIPVIIYVMNSVFNEQSGQSILIAIWMAIFLAIQFVSRFSLLGVFNVRSVIIIEFIGTVSKFTVGYTLTKFNFEFLAILYSFLAFAMVTAILEFIISYKQNGFKFEGKQLIKDTIKSGLVNSPTKLSVTIMPFLSIVLLPFFKIDDSSIAIFYMALMITLLASSLAKSVALMLVPTSSISSTDLSTDSTRLTLGLTVPIIVALLVIPKPILSLIRSDYSQGSDILQILALGLLPFVILINTVSKLNNMNKTRDLLVMGIVQILTLIISFLFLVPLYHIMGAAVSILIAYTSSTIIAARWFERKLIKHILISCFSLAIGWIVGYSAKLVDFDYSIILGASITICTLLILGLKQISIPEITQIMKNLIKKQ
jgi:O-antigen/teichoic acid export membrane protein